MDPRNISSGESAERGTDIFEGWGVLVPLPERAAWEGKVVSELTSKRDEIIWILINQCFFIENYL